MLRVFALACGTIEFDRSLFFPAQARGERMETPVSSFLVAHPAGKLLFDTGVHCDAVSDPVARLGKRVASLFTIRACPGEGVVDQLAAIGVAPGEIRYVVNSHLHFDHCGCNALFRGAEFLVQRAELQAARADPARYIAKDWDHPLAYREVDGEHDVFGDGTVLLLPTPGHTPGHQSLWIRAAGGPEIVLTADASYTREHLEKSILPAAVYDAAQMTHSLGVLRKLRERRGVELLYGHDAQQWAALPRAPRPLV